MSEEQAAGASKAADVSTVESPPTSFTGILLRLGPGLIVAGSIVGSGELIATTSTGAQAGFWLLWLILIGCVIKVFVQVEMGRYTIVTGRTTMDGLAEVPGPCIPGRGNWLVWYWFIMFSASIAQLGGIVGGVGQALSISAPITDGGRQYNRYVEAETELVVRRAELGLCERLMDEGDRDANARASQLRSEIVETERLSSQGLLVLKQAELQSVQRNKNSYPNNASRIELLRDEIDAIQRFEEQFASVAADHAFKLRVEKLLPKVSLLVERFVANSVRLDRINDNLAKLAGRTSARAEQETQRLKSEQQELRRDNDSSRSSIIDLDAQLKTDGFAQSYLAAKLASKPQAPLDDKIWATVITCLTAMILIYGRYGLIQSFATAMVASFTLITIINLVMLQSSSSWGVSVQDIVNGMSFRLPPAPAGEKMRAITTALATFGIIGVGASELVTYPYWCLEKGYARFTGPRDNTPSWAERARGWMRVMRWDAWCSMVVYTFATVAFYLLGAAILQRTGLDPQGTEMIRYLSVMYLPVFGKVTQLLFLFGAFAVLYSTFFVANASQARVFSDALRVLHLAPKGEQSYRRRVRFLSGLFPFLCLSFFVTGFDPRSLVMLSGVMQAVMLPMLAVAALFFRYRRSDERVRPGKWWDAFLWVSAAGLFVAGVSAAVTKIVSLF